MSFINTNTNTSVIRAKLTERGRELLSEGNLTYRYWAVGDSEIDYNFIDEDMNGNKAKILTPKDKTRILKTPIPQLNGGSIYNTLTSTNVAPKTVYGENVMKGFFTLNRGDYDVNTDLFKGIGTTVNGSLNGLKNLTFTLSEGEIEEGDIIILGIPTSTQENVSPSSIKTNTPINYLAFKVFTKNSSTSITLDRELPYYNNGNFTCSLYVIEGNDPINNFYSKYEPTYWDYDNLSFQTNDNKVANDVGVWNFNVVLTENLAGLVNESLDNIYEYKGVVYSGFKNYITTGSYNDKKVLGIIHFSNNMTTNIYGEGFKSASFKLHLPTVLWHKINQPSGAGDRMGLTLVSQAVEGQEYDNLIDGLGNIVGKVLRNDHMAIIEDEELVMAISYKSNRNWTLPTLNLDLIAQSGGGALIDENQELYCTYLLSNTTNTGVRTAMHCMNYVKAVNGGVGKESARLTFPKGQLPFLRAAGNEGNGGFVASKIFILMQLTPKGVRPTKNNWRIYDVTTEFGGLGDAPLNPTYMEMIDVIIDKSTYNSQPIYDISNHIVGFENGVDSLNIGDEDILFGTVEVKPTAKVYKTSFVLPLMFNHFRVSNNPTYDMDGGKPVYISEIGIYDGNQELVLVGKLSTPIKKENSDVILLQLEIDF